MKSPLEIPTEAAPKCAACSGEGRNILQDCADYVCGLPGRWTFAQCGECRSLWPNPRPVASAIPLLYPENYHFTRTADALPSETGRSVTGAAKLAVLAREWGYESLTAPTHNKVGVWLARALGPLMRRKAGYSVRFLHRQLRGKLLDVGCGNGAFLHSMSQLGWEVEGIELDPIAAQQAIARGIRVQVGDLHDADLPPNSFDAITLTHVIEHFADPAEMLRILHAALKPGGVLVSVSPNPAGVLRRVFGNKWYALDPPRHLFLPTATACRRMLEPVGFEVTTWTLMRAFRWYFKESLSISTAGKVGAVGDSAVLKVVALVLAPILSCLPEPGEELVCFARKS